MQFFYYFFLLLPINKIGYSFIIYLQLIYFNFLLLILVINKIICLSNNCLDKIIFVTLIICILRKVVILIAEIIKVFLNYIENFILLIDVFYFNKKFD